MSLHNVVLLSGGIDSAVCYKKALERSDNTHAVFFRYGQEAVEFEERAAKQLVNDENDTIHLIDYEPVFNNFRGGLLDRDEYNMNYQTDGRHSVGYVPQRNLHFLTSAAAYAESKTGMGDNINLYFGPQLGDSGDYPDCRDNFVTAAMKALNYSTDERQITIETPILEKSKTEVIEMGEELGVDWSHTVSCYAPPGPKKGCAECPACLERRRAFEEAGVIDPVQYVQ